MKTMTRDQLGGACAKEFHAASFEEMAEMSKQHGMEMFKQQDEAHLKAMSDMQALMKEPEAMKAWFENKKRVEHAKDDPDVNMIAEWDNLSRDCCEFRSLLKRELNSAVVEFVQTFQYKTLKEARTFRPPKIIEDDNTVGDIVADMCMNVAEQTFENPEEPPKDLECNEKRKEELTEVFRGMRATKQYKILRNRKDL